MGATDPQVQLQERPVARVGNRRIGNSWRPEVFLGLTDAPVIKPTPRTTPRMHGFLRREQNIGQRDPKQTPIVVTACATRWREGLGRIGAWTPLWQTAREGETPAC